jgi:hypothetical protein
VRKRLIAPNFPDLDALQGERIATFIEEWNRHAHPLRWTTKSVDKVVAKIHAALATSA